MRGFVLAAAAVLAACGSDSKSSAPPQSTPLGGRIGGQTFTPVETRAMVLGSGSTPCMLVDPTNPTTATTIGIKAVVIETASFAGVCEDLASVQCRHHKSSQAATILVAKVNLAPPYNEPSLDAGTYTVTGSLIPSNLTPPLITTGWAQALAVDAAYVATTSASAAGTIRLDPVTASTVTGHVAITFDQGNSLSGDFTASACPAQDACVLAGMIAAALVPGGGASGICVPPPVQVP